MDAGKKWGFMETMTNKLPIALEFRHFGISCYILRMTFQAAGNA